MKISVVIPCHNAERWLGQTLGSLLEQTLRPHEIIVVLDRCSDASLSIAQGHDVSWIEVDFGCAQRARNLGASLVSGDALMFMDADDVIAPPTLEALARALAELGEGFALCPWFRLEEEGGQWVRRPASVPTRPQPADLLSGWLQGWYYPPCSVLWSRAAFQQTGGWAEDVRVNQDGDLMLRALADGIPYVRTTAGEAFYRRIPGAQSTSGKRFSEEGRRGQLRLYEKLAVRLEHNGRIHRYRREFADALLAEEHRCRRQNATALADQAAALRREFGPRSEAVSKSLALVPGKVRRALEGRQRSYQHLRLQGATLEGVPITHGLGVEPSGRAKPMPMPPTPPTVSVVVPTYNRAQLVQRAIASVLGQSYTDFELLVVDDGSTDDTEQVIGAFADARVRYLPQPRNMGVSEARNRGMREARGAFIAFLDSDDEWFPTKLEKQMKLLETAAPDVGLVYSGARVELPDRIRIERPSCRGDVYRRMLVRNVLTGGAQSSVIRRDVITTAGFFDSEIPAMEDYDYWIRVARFFAVDFVDEPLIRYHDADDPERRSRNRRADDQSRELIYCRNRRALQARGLAGEFLRIGAKRRLTWFGTPDRPGALWLAARACVQEPGYLEGWRELLHPIIPKGWRRALKSGLRPAAR